MNRGLLALLALLVVSALGAAVWLLLGDSGEPSGAGAALAELDVEARGAEMPPEIVALDPLRTDPTGLVAELQEPGVEAPIELRAPRIGRFSGTIRGRLVDVVGTPLPDEPVLLAFEPKSTFYDDEARVAPTRLGEVMDRGRSDADGRFELRARPTHTHLLQVGGRLAAPRLLEGVSAGAELELVLERGLVFEGHVLADESGEPIEGAIVGALAGPQHMLGHSDAAGRFELAPLPDEPHFVGAWAPGYDVFSELLAPGLGERELRLPPGRPVAGRLVDASTGVGVAGLEVRMLIEIEARWRGASTLDEPSQTAHEFVTTTAADGSFLIEDAPSKSFELRVEAPGWLPLRVSRWADRDLGLEEVAELLLEPLPEVEVLVIDGESSRVEPGAQMSLRAAGRELQAGFSDANGRFALELGDWSGRERLHVLARDELGRTARARVKPGKEDGPLELVLSEPVKLSVLTTRSGVPLPDVEVTVSSARSEPTVGFSDTAGLATITHELAEPSQQLRVLGAYADHRSLQVVVPLPLANDEPIEIDFDGGVFLDGRVVDVDGDPIRGATLSAESRRQDANAHSDAEGAFHLGPFAHDATVDVIQVSAPGFLTEGFREISLGAEELLFTLRPVHQLRGRLIDGISGLPPKAFDGRLQREVRSPDGKGWQFRNQLAEVRPDGREPGHFSIPLSEAGRYRVRVNSPESLLTESVAVDYDGLSDPPELEIELRPAAGLEVFVRDASGGAVQGLRLSLFPWAHAEAWERATGKQRMALRKRATEKRTDSSGRVRFKLGQGGAFALIQAEAGRRFGGKLLIEPGLPRIEEIAWGWTGDLALSVRDSYGAVVERARVTLMFAGNGALRRSERVSKLNGVASIERLIPGRYEVDVTASGYAPRSMTVEIVAGLGSTRDVVLKALSTEEERRLEKTKRRKGSVISARSGKPNKAKKPR